MENFSRKQNILCNQTHWKNLIGWYFLNSCKYFEGKSCGQRTTSHNSSSLPRGNSRILIRGIYLGRQSIVEGTFICRSSAPFWITPLSDPLWFSNPSSVIFSSRQTSLLIHQVTTPRVTSTTSRRRVCDRQDSLGIIGYPHPFLKGLRVKLTRSPRAWFLTLCCAFIPFKQF